MDDRRAPVFPFVKQPKAQRDPGRGSSLKLAADELEQAIGEYKAAVLAAPWWADAYKKLAMAQEAAEHYDDAVASLNLYLLFQPADARDAQDEVYKLKADKQAAVDEQLKKQREQQQQAEAEARKRAKEQELDGAIFVSRPIPDGAIGYEGLYNYQVYRIDGQSVRFGFIEGVQLSADLKYAPIRDDGFADGSRSQSLRNRQFTILGIIPGTSTTFTCTGTISDDGQFLTQRCPNDVPYTFTRLK